MLAWQHLCLAQTAAVLEGITDGPQNLTFLSFLCMLPSGDSSCRHVQAKWIQRDLSFDRSEVSERCRKTSKQTNTIAPRRNVSTNIWARRSNLSWRGLVGRRALTVTPKEKPQTQQQKQATKKLKVPPRFINGSGQSTRGQPLPFKRKWLFTIKQLYFLLFCCVLVGDPSTIKVESP